MEKSQGCLMESRQTRRKKLRQHFASVMPDASLPAHKSSYMQCRLMRRYPLCGASGARVSAVSPRGSRPTARFIEYNCVLCVGAATGVVTRVAVLTLALGQRNARASLPASVTPAARLAQREKSARESNLAQ
jgi:hypothetical protein